MTNYCTKHQQIYSDYCIYCGRPLLVSGYNQIQLERELHKRDVEQTQMNLKEPIAKCKHGHVLKGKNLIGFTKTRHIPICRQCRKIAARKAYLKSKPSQNRYETMHDL